MTGWTSAIFATACAAAVAVAGSIPACRSGAGARSGDVPLPAEDAVAPPADLPDATDDSSAAHDPALPFASIEQALRLPPCGGHLPAPVQRWGNALPLRFDVAPSMARPGARYVALATTCPPRGGESLPPAGDWRALALLGTDETRSVVIDDNVGCSTRGTWKGMWVCGPSPTLRYYAVGYSDEGRAFCAWIDDDAPFMTRYHDLAPVVGGGPDEHHDCEQSPGFLGGAIPLSVIPRCPTCSSRLVVVYAVAAETNDVLGEMRDAQVDHAAVLPTLPPGTVDVVVYELLGPHRGVVRGVELPREGEDARTPVEVEVPLVPLGGPEGQLPSPEAVRLVQEFLDAARALQQAHEWWMVRGECPSTAPEILEPGARLRALGEEQAVQALDAIASLPGGGAGVGLREAALDVLASYETEAAYDVLVRRTDWHGGHRSRRGTCGSERLEALGAKVVPALVRAFGDPRALRCSRRERPWEHPVDIRNRVGCFAPNRYDHIADLVVRAGDPRGLPLLDALLGIPDGGVARQVGTGIALLGGTSRRVQLVDLLASPDVWKRAAGIHGLRVLGERSAVGEMLLVLGSEDREIPTYSFRGLVDSPDPRLPVRCVQYYRAEARRRETLGSFEATAVTPPDCPAPPPPPTLHEVASLAIDALTGEDLHGDIPRIEAWIRAHPPAPDLKCPPEDLPCAAAVRDAMDRYRDWFEMRESELTSAGGIVGWLHGLRVLRNIDLDGDGVADPIVRVVTGGNGGDDYNFYVARGDGAERVGGATGFDLRLLSACHLGYVNLESWVHLGAYDTVVSRYRFDGAGYRPFASMECEDGCSPWRQPAADEDPDAEVVADPSGGEPCSIPAHVRREPEGDDRFVGCGPVPNSASWEPRAGVRVVQDGREAVVEDGGVARLERAPYCLRFALGDRADALERTGLPAHAQVVLSRTEPEFAVRAGMPADETPWFCGGCSGVMEDPSDGMRWTAPDASHIVLYSGYHACEDETGDPDRTAILVETLPDGRYVVDWKVDGVAPTVFRDYVEPRLFVIAYIDQDHDRILDEGEFQRFAIEFAEDEDGR